MTTVNGDATEGKQERKLSSLMWWGSRQGLGLSDTNGDGSMDIGTTSSL